MMDEQRFYGVVPYETQIHISDMEWSSPRYSCYLVFPKDYYHTLGQGISIGTQSLGLAVVHVRAIIQKRMLCNHLFNHSGGYANCRWCSATYPIKKPPQVGVTNLPVTWAEYNFPPSEAETQRAYDIMVKRAERNGVIDHLLGPDVD